MAGSKPWSQVPVTNRDYTTAAVVIVGAGISGICTAIDLVVKNKCRNFIVVEKSNGLGGTWKDNTYPGCCCDVESILYSYSFEQKSNWTRIYPGQEEILEYLIDTAQKYDLFKHIRFNTAAEAASWDEETSTWKTKLRVLGGKEAERHPEYTITSSFLVTGVGQLNQPRYPKISGMDTFNGKMMHSARWDWTYDLTGKRVAVIGNGFVLPFMPVRTWELMFRAGCTAAQIIPEVAKVASQLTVLQRSPAYVIPRYDAPVSSLWQGIYKYIPPVRKRIRADIMDFREDVLFNAVKKDSEASEVLRNMAIEHIREQLPHRPDLWEKLTPTYPVGCKRAIISSDFYCTLGQESVQLETRRVLHMNADGIEVDGEKLKFDVIVFATGFETTNFFQNSIQLTGSGGRTLKEVWKDSPTALYGITVESMPNFAMLYGPNTNLGHNSIVLMIEAQSRYINGLISAVLNSKASGRPLCILPDVGKLVEYNTNLQKVLSQSSYAHPSCNSWYKNADGIITQNWSGTVIEYQKKLSIIDWDDYTLSETGAALIPCRRVHVGRAVEETWMSYKTMSYLASGGGVLATGLILALPLLVGLA